MPKTSVSNESREYRTRKVGQDSPSVNSTDNPSDAKWNCLGYMYGATCEGGSNDMGAENNDPFSSPTWDGSEWRENYRARRELRRHTVEQGSSTFAWPKKS